MSVTADAHTYTTSTHHRDSQSASKPKQSKSSRRGSHGASSLDDPELYINRELSLLAFQKRVLEEAEDQHTPLLERVKFLSILGSNLDEFFMVRVAGLKRQAESGVLECGPDGMTPKEQLGAIRERAFGAVQSRAGVFASAGLAGPEKGGSVRR